MASIHIDINTLPDITQNEMDFSDSSFFKDNPLRKLPHPIEALTLYEQSPGKVLTLEHLDMVVKINNESRLRLEEVQTMYALRQAFPSGEIPVPEVFGWRKYEGRVFVYMSLVKGETLYQAWPKLTVENKTRIQTQLREMIASIRRLAPLNHAICSINGGAVQDRYFQHDNFKGPFPSPQTFNDTLFALATRQTPSLDRNAIKWLQHPDMLRDLLPDTHDHPILFSHGDLTPSNIILSASSQQGQYTIVGIIDWEQAGWYLEYWEYCKMLLGCDYEHGYRVEGWPESLTRPFEDAFWALAQYSLWRGGT